MMNDLDECVVEYCQESKDNSKPALPVLEKSSLKTKIVIDYCSTDMTNQPALRQSR